MADPTPSLRIVDYNIGELQGIRGVPGAYKSADFGVWPAKTTEVKSEWLRDGADLSPGATHMILRVGARFWNAGKGTFKIGSAWERKGTYFKSVSGADWDIALAGVWRFELAYGAEKDLVRAKDLRCVITPSINPLGETHAKLDMWDWQLESGFACEAMGEPYLTGMVFDITDVKDNVLTDPADFYWWKMILDPQNKWGQRQELEFKVTKRVTDFNLFVDRPV